MWRPLFPSLCYICFLNGRAFVLISFQLQLQEADTLTQTGWFLLVSPPWESTSPLCSSLSNCQRSPMTGPGDHLLLLQPLRNSDRDLLRPCSRLWVLDLLIGRPSFGNPPVASNSLCAPVVGRPLSCIPVGTSSPFFCGPVIAPLRVPVDATWTPRMLLPFATQHCLQSLCDRLVFYFPPLVNCAEKWGYKRRKE